MCNLMQNKKGLILGVARDFETLTRVAESNAPLHRAVTQDEVGRTALFLLSDLSSGITGEVLFCDAGYNIIGAAFNPAD